MIIASFTTVPLLLFSLLFAYVSHHICLGLAAAPPLYPIVPISLNSLDLTGVRLLSPRGSQIITTTVAGTGCDDHDVRVMIACFGVLLLLLL